MSPTLNLAIGGALIAAVAVAAVVLGTTERPPMDSIQRGYRGLAMSEIYNPRLLNETIADNKVPLSIPPLGNGGPKASAVYKNVQVLGDESVGNFTRLMASITNWVSPVQGCAYCHDVNNMAADTVYTKVVSRRMLQMVRHINANWKTHVVETGVVCYTCHRGNPVPKNIWFADPGPEGTPGYTPAVGKNHPATVAGITALPLDPFTPFLEGDKNIRVQGPEALPGWNNSTIKQTEWTYSLMMNFSQSLGVNCTYCHNTRAFYDWGQSPPQRATAWYGIRMVRDLNDNYLDPLKPVFPASRLGPLGDGPKVYCATCHNGVYKPLFGISMAKNFPELTTVSK
jgi:photosynthetic reaction center cytochrome c subunit